MSKKKKVIIISSIAVVVIAIITAVLLLGRGKTKVSTLKELPKPEITGGSRGELGIDKNINESTIDEYLNRPDSVYRDMRMLEDPGNYEAIGGDRYLSGYIEGFEVIPLPYIIPVTGLPSEVGDTYTGETLFYEDNGTYVANYEESMKIIEEIFPKDKVIFLMCGGGGYAGMTKNFLVSLGWDENKIYNVGGYWYYKGAHNVTVKKEENGVVTYDFDKVPYHDIKFDELTKTTNYKEPEYKVTEIKLSTAKIEIEEGSSFQLNAIVLPNNAKNKEVKWTSSHESVASVSEEGLVKGLSAGESTITVETVEGNKVAKCEVKVNKKQIQRVILDDISSEAKEHNAMDPIKLENEFDELTRNPDGTPSEKYHDRVGENGYKVNDLWREEYKKYQEKQEENSKKRKDILNRLLQSKKSFVVLIYTKHCEESSYRVIDGAKRVLDNNNIPYLYTYAPASAPDEAVISAKDLGIEEIKGSIIIVKDGEVYVNVDTDVDSIKSDEEVKSWLSKYIDVR